MSNLEKQHKLWDEFLKTWPISRLEKMELDDYTKAGSQDTFTYWLESRLNKMGSISGGSAFKFGVFSRKETEEKDSVSTRMYSGTHGWYASLGDNVEEAFQKVRDFVVQVAILANQGDIDSIESIPLLGKKLRWKIAFHYQNRDNPSIVGIFTKANLAAFTEEMAIKPMPELQRAAIRRMPSGSDILEFGWKIWDESKIKLDLNIWKLSHGKGRNAFDDKEQNYFLENSLAVIHEDTPRGAGRKFIEQPLGTFFYLCHSNSPQVLGYFTSNATPCIKKGDGWLQREYQSIKVAISDKPYSDRRKGWTPNFNSTFMKVPKDSVQEFEGKLLKPYFNLDLSDLAYFAEDEIILNDQGNYNINNERKKTQNVPCMNRIFYGPPGTGKTYELMKILKENYEHRPEYATSDEQIYQFVSEKLPDLTWWQLIAATIYKIGKDRKSGMAKVKVKEIVDHRLTKAYAAIRGVRKLQSQRIWAPLLNHAVENSATIKYENRHLPHIFDKTQDSRWYLSGDWEEECKKLVEIIDELDNFSNLGDTIKRYDFVTFHQSYGYEEFVEGIRPRLDDDVEGNDATRIQYEIRPGAFKLLCDRARLEKNRRFAFVIDEINRGNISKIFGELITLIESDKREGGDNAITTTLPYSGEKFSVPFNVDIFGTMNTADRSLTTLDTALRRRFEFIHLAPDTRDSTDTSIDAPLAGLRVNKNEREINIPEMLGTVNRRIEALYDRDHCIGHAYFMSLHKAEDGETRFDALADIFKSRVLPLLEEYFFEDWEKIRLVLADNQKPTQLQFVIEGEPNKDHEEQLYQMFGENYVIDTYATKKGFRIQKSAFEHPDSYIGIYSKVRS